MLHILGSPSSYMNLHPIPSEFPNIWGKFCILFGSVLSSLTLPTSQLLIAPCRNLPLAPFVTFPVFLVPLRPIYFHRLSIRFFASLTIDWNPPPPPQYGVERRGEGRYVRVKKTGDSHFLVYIQSWQYWGFVHALPLSLFPPLHLSYVIHFTPSPARSAIKSYLNYPILPISSGNYFLICVGIFKEILRNSLRLTWGWPEVFSMTPFVKILNRWAWPELFSLTLLRVFLDKNNEWEEAFFLLIAFSDLCCDT